MSKKILPVLTFLGILGLGIHQIYLSHKLSVVEEQTFPMFHDWVVETFHKTPDNPATEISGFISFVYKESGIYYLDFDRVEMKPPRACESSQIMAFPCFDNNTPETEKFIISTDVLITDFYIPDGYEIETPWPNAPGNNGSLKDGLHAWLDILDEQPYRLNDDYYTLTIENGVVTKITGIFTS